MFVRRIRVAQSPRTGRSKSNRIGAAALEFAIVLPLLILILAAAIDFSRFAYTSISVSNSARAGAGYGIFHPLDDYTKSRWLGKISDAIKDELSGWGSFDVSKLSVTSDQVSSEGDKRVVVQVSYPFTTNINWGFFPSTMSIQQSVVLPMIR